MYFEDWRERYVPPLYIRATDCCYKSKFAGSNNGLEEDYKKRQRTDNEKDALRQIFGQIVSINSTSCRQSAFDFTAYMNL